MNSSNQAAMETVRTKVDVYNLRTGVRTHFGNMSPKQALMNAYFQQEEKDFATWNYPAKYTQYDNRIQYGSSGSTAFLGDLGVRID